MNSPDKDLGDWDKPTARVYPYPKVEIDEDVVRKYRREVIEKAEAENGKKRLTMFA